VLAKLAEGGPVDSHPRSARSSTVQLRFALSATNGSSAPRLPGRPTDAHADQGEIAKHRLSLDLGQRHGPGQPLAAQGPRRRGRIFRFPSG